MRTKQALPQKHTAIHWLIVQVLWDSTAFVNNFVVLVISCMLYYPPLEATQAGPLCNPLGCILLQDPSMPLYMPCMAIAVSKT